MHKGERQTYTKHSHCNHETAKYINIKSTEICSLLPTEYLSLYCIQVSLIPSKLVLKS